MIGSVQAGLGRKRNHAWVLSLFLAAVVGMALAGCGGGGGTAPPLATVVLEGTVVVPWGVAVDSDVNDPNQPYRTNDTALTPQPIGNPISLGGYVNAPGAGPEGFSKTAGDPDDYFQVFLNSGDRIFLAIGDPHAADLDLSLLDSSGNLLAASVGAGAFEALSAPASGTYLVRVNALGGASNYILTIGAGVSGTDLVALSSDHDFVPGQAIVRFADSAQASASTRSLAEQAGAWGMNLETGQPGREVLLTFGDGAQEEAALRSLAIGDGRPPALGGDEELRRKLDTLRVIKALRKHPDVRSADPNYMLHHYATTPNDTYYHLQWHYPLIGLPLAWDLTTGSAEVVVAVVDTGVLIGHPDLQGQLTRDGYDFISDPARSNDGDGIDPNPDDPGDGATPGASSFHGTHVAGTVAARTDNGLGVAGVGWQTRIMPIRALGKGGGTLYDILQGVRYAAGLPNDSGTLPGRAADIINLSLGGGGFSSAAQELFSQARQAGVILIAAAGNESTDIPAYPAAYEGVIAVSAVNINATLASYSNYGGHIDVAAPGGDAGDLDGDGYPDRVWSTSGDDSSGTIQYTYAAASGTSMATPHVAGVVAIMKALRPELTPDDLETYLRSGRLTTDIGAPGRDDLYGYGLLNAFKAVLAVSQDPPTVLRVDPLALNFGVTATEGILTVSKIGSESIGVEGVTDDADWLSISAETIDANGLGSYLVRVDRNGLGEGAYRAVITVTPTLGDPVSVVVNLQVATANVFPDAGFHYVLLIDADSDEIVDQYEAQAAEGRYVYRFTGVPQGGRYLIFAGSDRDNDFYIDNAAESLGAYPNLDQITVVAADSDRTDLDFTTDLRLFLPTAAGPVGAAAAWPVLQRLR